MVGNRNGKKGRQYKAIFFFFLNLALQPNGQTGTHRGNKERTKCFVNEQADRTAETEETEVPGHKPTTATSR